MREKGMKQRRLSTLLKWHISLLCGDQTYLSSPMTAFDITTHTLDQPEKTVKEYVLEDFRTASIFEKYGLDFCCGGGRSVLEACSHKGLDYDAIQRELDELEISGKGAGATNRFQEWSITFLSTYVVQNHHNYIRSVVPAILTHAQKVGQVHAERWPYMIEVASIFADLASELTSHLHKEEAILFPRLRQLDNAAGGTAARSRYLGGPIAQMMAEHDEAGALMERINKLTNHYTLPEGGCTTFSTLLSELQDFERDLHQHVFLENNILFPKALALEETMLKAEATNSCEIKTSCAI
jgi:regulator of cell morphogenesis and NO signaling